MGSGMASSILSPEIFGRPRRCANRAPSSVNRGRRHSRDSLLDSSPELRALCSLFALESMAKPHGQLVPVSSASLTLPHPAYQPRSLRGAFSALRQGHLVLRPASRLYAFSGYLFRAWLPGYARGLTTGSPEARPPRSSRTMGSSSQVSYAHGR